jgi:hypothetical protein
MKYRRSISLLIAAVAMQFVVCRSEADNTPVWTFEVPASTLTSDGSAVASITADVAGNTLIIIQHTTTFMFAPFPSGSQIILLDNRGRLVGAGDFASLNNAVPAFVSAKKAVISSGGLQELTVGPNKTLVASALPFQSVDETLANAPDAKTVDHKFVHSSESTAGKVSEIRCYVMKKLKPLPGCHCADEEE